MIDVVVSSDAEQDIKLGARYYDSKEVGLGGYFRFSILTDLTSLEILGGTHARKYNLHRKLCKSFPFWIYYRMDSASSLTVVPIIGQRRGDEYHATRLCDQ